MLKDAGSKPLALVWHSTMLQSTSKNNDIPSFSFHLYSICVEFLRLSGYLGFL